MIRMKLENLTPVMQSISETTKPVSLNKYKNDKAGRNTRLYYDPYQISAQ
jgi:hypothetical protein